jgi:hypothetical protein
VITAVFSENLNSSSIKSLSFTLKKGAEPIDGSVLYNNSTRTARFSPSETLSYNTTYTASLSRGVKDTSGNSLAAVYTWSFSTALQPTPSPTISPSPTPTIGINVSIGSSSSVQAGGNLDVNINFDVNTAIIDAPSLGGFTFDLKYDASVLHVVGNEGGATGVTAGLLGSIAVSPLAWGYIEPGEPGVVRVVWYRRASGDYSGSGYLAQIHFTVGDSVQSTKLTLLNVEIVDEFGDPSFDYSISGSKNINITQ